tara:strand:- start:3027 stop:3968 length:942 start_codon:yes stop_codon:yes gene_type:complete
MVKKILVTGGAGYIGTSLVPKLLDLGHEVTVFDNLMVGGNQLLPFFKYDNFKFVRGDIRKIDELKEVVKDKDVIIHLAALVGFPVCRLNPQLAREINVDGTVNLIDSCTDEQVIFYGSTGSNYGAVTDICTEETPLHPLSLYGETKTKAEQLLMERGNTIAYRFATAFGVSPRFRLDLLINDFSYKCIKDGYLVVYEKNYMRTFIHVSDIAECFTFGIKNMDKMMGNVFNVGDDNMNHSKEEVCNMIGKKTGAFIHYEEIGEDADQRNYVVSYEKIRDLGFKTSISVEHGIDEVINALKVTDFQNQYTNARYI